MKSDTNTTAGSGLHDADCSSCVSSKIVDPLGDISALSKAVYHWDVWTISRDDDHLRMAELFMDKYYTSGGRDYCNLRDVIQKTTRNVLLPKRSLEEISFDLASHKDVCPQAFHRDCEEYRKLGREFIHAGGRLSSWDPLN